MSVEGDRIDDLASFGGRRPATDVAPVAVQADPGGGLEGWLGDEQTELRSFLAGIYSEGGVLVIGPPGALQRVRELEATVTVDIGTVTLTIDVTGKEARWVATIKPNEASASLSSRTLARFGLGDVQRRVAEALPLVLQMVAPGQKSQLAAPKGGRPAGRGGHSDQQYAIWANDYVHACEVAPRRPIAWLVENYHLDNRGVPTTTAALWRRRLVEARKRRLLVGGRKGAAAEAAGTPAGGRLSKKAKQLLKEVIS